MKERKKRNEMKNNTNRDIQKSRKQVEKQVGESEK